MLLIYKPQYSLGRKRSAQRRYKKQRTQLPPFVPLEKEITFLSLLLFVVSQKKLKVKGNILSLHLPADSLKDKLIFL